MTLRPARSLFVAAVALACAHGAFAQETPPAQPPAPEPQPAPLPDLDDLLGLPKPAQPEPEPGAAPAPRPDDAIKTELDRRLADKEIDDNFKLAIQLMSDAAERLAGPRDAGLQTQRTQEEIIRRLDALIAAAKERESKSSQSSSQSQSQRDQRQQPANQQQQQQAQSRQPGKAENSAELTPPGLRTGALNKDALDAAVASWGALPERIRDSLLQGMGDTFSSLYDAMTQEYYRRLAEEKPRE